MLKSTGTYFSIFPLNLFFLKTLLTFQVKVITNPINTRTLFKATLLVQFEKPQMFEKRLFLILYTYEIFTAYYVKDHAKQSGITKRK